MPFLAKNWEKLLLHSGPRGWGEGDGHLCACQRSDYITTFLITDSISRRMSSWFPFPSQESVEKEFQLSFVKLDNMLHDYYTKSKEHEVFVNQVEHK